ncbi:PrsW family glutamic-type intramembrane protease [Spirillospora sp. NPDC052242]
MTGRPAFWLWAGTCALGVWLAFDTVGAMVRAFPVGAVAGSALLAPALVLGVWALRRTHPVRVRPLWAALLAVGWGGLAAFGVALPANAAFLAVIGQAAGPEFAAVWGATIAAPVNEEPLKLLGVVVLALAVPCTVRSAMDGWGYGALAGLGFQMSENFLYVLNTILLTGATQDAGAAFVSFAGRVVGGAWWSHWAMTAVAGAGLGRLLARASRTNAALAAGALLLAMALHAWWDAPVLADAALLPFKGLPILLAAVLAYRLARRGYLAHFRRAADAETAGGVLVPGERHVLTYRRWRRKERWDVPPGEPRLLLARLRAAELDLLESGLGGIGRDPGEAERLRGDIRELRLRLNASWRRTGTARAVR